MISKYPLVPNPTILMIQTSEVSKWFMVLHLEDALFYIPLHAEFHFMFGFEDSQIKWLNLYGLSLGQPSSIWAGLIMRTFWLLKFWEYWPKPKGHSNSPFGCLSEDLDVAAKRWPAFFQAIIAVSLLPLEVTKLMLGTDLIMCSLHHISELLSATRSLWLSGSGFLKYQAMLLIGPAI